MLKHRIINIIPVISVLIVLLLPLYSKYVLFPSYNSFMIDQAERILKGIGRHMIEENNIPEPISLNSPLPMEFINDIEHIRETNGLWKVKFFTPEGRIVYSTNSADVGNQTRKTFFPEMFRDDKLRSHIDTKVLSEGDGIAGKTHYFIETYVPIEYETIPVGAFEIYYDITDIKQSFEKLKYDEQKVMGPIILLLLAGGLFSSYLAHKNMSALRRSKEKFKEMSILDELTGLLNRRGFSNQLDKQLKALKGSGSSAFLVFIDLNDFKEINDTFGHEIGDEALIETAKLLQATFRSSDTIGHLGGNVIGRLGGDEFAVLGSQIADTTDTSIIHERLDANIIKWNEVSNAAYKLSLSFGIALYSSESPCSADELISRADQLMYQQKQERKQHRQT